jgi:hypothetical protein
MIKFQEYEQDIIALEQLDFELFGSDLDERLDELAKEFEKVITPLQDGTIDSGDLETVREGFWARSGSKEIESAKKQVAIHRKLRELYEHLGTASEDEWVGFCQDACQCPLPGRFNTDQASVQSFGTSGRRER